VILLGTDIAYQLLVHLSMIHSYFTSSTAEETAFKQFNDLKIAESSVFIFLKLFI